MMRTLLAFTMLVGLGATSLQASPPKRPPAKAARPAPRNWIAIVVPTPEGGVRMGNPAASIKLIEYGSRTCPHCARFDRDGVPVLRSKYIATGQLSYEFRDYPVHGALDLGPILLGHCVGPAQFFPLLGQMMAAQAQLLGQVAPIPDADKAMLENASPNQVASYFAKFYGYLDFMKQHGVPLARARACLADKKAIDAIARNADAAAAKYGVASTPTFIVNGEVARNTYDWASLEPVLRAAGAK